MSAEETQTATAEAVSEAQPEPTHMEEEEFEEEGEEEVGEEGEETEQPQTPSAPKPAPTKVETPINFSLTDEKKQVLRTIIGILDELGMVDVSLEYNGNLNLAVMNPSRTVMVVSTIDLGAGLTATAETIRTFTCELQNLKKVLGLSDVNVKVEQSEAIFYGVVDYTKKMKVVVPLVENSEEKFPQPKVTLEVDAELDFSRISKALGVLSIAPSCLILDSFQDGTLQIRGSNDAQQKFEINGLKSKGVGKASFSLELLRALGKSEWHIQYTTEMPMKATKIYSQTTYQGTTVIKTDLGMIAVWIAPRIEVD